MTSGTVTVTITLETTITVNYVNQIWAIPANATPGSYFLVLPRNGAVPVLGHPPYQFSVTSVAIPSGLAPYVTISPSKRVIAINSTVATVVVSEVNSALNASGGFNVPPTTPAPAGPYTVTVGYSVTDNHGIVSTGSATVAVTIS
jgi:hypothetical protein